MPTAAVSNWTSKGSHVSCAPKGRGDLDRRQGAGAITPSQRRPLPLTTQVRSDERFDKSIVSFHYRVTRASAPLK
jgi:hypothetical protein